MRNPSRVLLALLTTLTPITLLCAQDDAPAPPPLRGSLVEDRAARKLVEAGDARIAAREDAKAIEIWQSVIERYPRSRVRYVAHLRLGYHFLERDRAHDKARGHFTTAAEDENPDDEQRAEASLQVGVCFYEARNFGKCFQVMRDVIQRFPVSQHVNRAYYYIGLGHFQLGHYSRAIEALEKVGTAFEEEDAQVERLEAGKRFFVKIEDADLAALDPGTPVKVTVRAASGDEEVVDCFSLGRNVRIVLGSVATELGRPVAGNGKLEVKGDDEVTVTYTDAHTADKQFDREVLRRVTVVGNARAAITDGAFEETLQGVVLGKTVNVRIVDADRDLSPAADSLKATVEVHRRKTDEEIERETLGLGGDGAGEFEVDDEGRPKIDPYRRIDSIDVTLHEVRVVHELAAANDDDGIGPTTGTEDDPTEPPTDPDDTPPAEPATEDAPADPMPAATPDDDAIHSGVFHATIPLVKTDTTIEGDDSLQALPGDLVRIVYIDERHTGEGVRQVRADVRAIEGNLGGVRVTRAVISDGELRIRTRLKTADALTRIGNRYKEFGLQKNAEEKYAGALAVCEEVTDEAGRLGGRLLEETYVQLWQIYFAMDKLELAASMAQRLQRDFPNSGFVDDALLQLADVARESGNTRRAIGIYNRLVRMEGSQLRGEAQFGIAECYEQMAEATTNTASAQLHDRAFQEYKKVFDNFPESGRVGEAVSRMAEFYYRQKDYARAIDTFETVLANHPDAKFLDVILFNYGRCLYRMNRRAEARQRFDQLIGDYPESPLAADAKKISEALAKAAG